MCVCGGRETADMLCKQLVQIKIVGQTRVHLTLRYDPVPKVKFGSKALSMRKVKEDLAKIKREIKNTQCALY